MRRDVKYGLPLLCLVAVFFWFRSHTEPPEITVASIKVIPPRPRLAVHKQIPPSIQIDSSLPSTAGLDASLKEQFQEILDTLAETASPLFAHYFKGIEVHGIPGSAVKSDDEFHQLQAYLDCTSSKGSWNYDPQGRMLNKDQAGLTVHKQSSSFATCDKKFYASPEPLSADDQHWDVRESLKFRWLPSDTCRSLLPSHLSDRNLTTLPTRKAFCKMLQHKYLLLLGDAPTQYLLHDLLLDWTSDAPLSCYGDLYCAEHEICGDWVDQEQGGDWMADTPVYRVLPEPPAKELSGTVLPKVATEQYATFKDIGQRQLSASSALLRYRRTDGLALHKSPSLPPLQAVFIHPKTGIRETNNYGFPDIRRSDMVILSKAPIPLPAASSSLGHLTKAIEDASSGKARLAAILEAVKQVTKQVWLPEALLALANSRSGDNLLIWRGNWRLQSDCVSGAQDFDETDFDWHEWWDSTGDGPAPYTSALTLKQILSTKEVDIVFYNLQTVIQDELMRKHVLPHAGTVFIDMATPMSIWRSGMIGGAGFVPDGNSSKATTPLARNCLQPCLPSAGMSVEEALIGALHRIFRWAWRDEADGGQSWSGPSYMPVRERARLLRHRPQSQ